MFFLSDMFYCIMSFCIVELVASWIGNLTAMGYYSSSLSATTYLNKDQFLLTIDLNWCTALMKPAQEEYHSITYCQHSGSVGRALDWGSKGC